MQDVRQAEQDQARALAHERRQERLATTATTGQVTGATGQIAGKGMEVGGKAANATGRDIRRSSTAAKRTLTAHRRFSRQGIRQQAEQAVSMAAHMGSARLLQIAWFSVPTLLGSLGALFYFHFHALGRILAPEIFCKFGSEWTGVKNKLTGKVTGPIGMFEIAGIILLDILVILIIFMIIAIPVILFDIIDNLSPLEFIKLGISAL